MLISNSTQPAKAVIIYDGDCPFCISQIKRIQNLDPNNLFEYMARQQAEAEERFPILKSVDFNQGMRLITSDGHTFSGADAVYQIARRLPLTRFIAWVYCIPGIKQIAQLIYAWIAFNRQRLGKTCQDSLCKVEDPSNNE